MEQTSREAWLAALLPIKEGGRLNQLLSVMTGGDIQYIQWLQDFGIAQMDAVT